MCLLKSPCTYSYGRLLQCKDEPINLKSSDYTVQVSINSRCIAHQWLSLTSTWSLTIKHLPKMSIEENTNDLPRPLTGERSHLLSGGAYDHSFNVTASWLRIQLEKQTLQIVVNIVRTLQMCVLIHIQYIHTVRCSRLIKILLLKIKMT